MITDPDTRILGRTPGLPDDTFEHDGLITKRHLRASALAFLRPQPGELLWDLGAGAGSVAIEWCRAGTGRGPSPSNGCPSGRTGWPPTRPG